MKIILLGAPGSGKGTLSKLITKDFGLPQISTGDLFRDCIKDGSEIGEKAKDYMNKGMLVPDEITNQLFGENTAFGEIGVIGFQRIQCLIQGCGQVLQLCFFFFWQMV